MHSIYLDILDYDTLPTSKISKSGESNQYIPIPSMYGKFTYIWLFYGKCRYIYIAYMDGMG